MGNKRALGVTESYVNIDLPKKGFSPEIIEKLVTELFVCSSGNVEERTYDAGVTVGPAIVHGGEGDR